MIQQIIPMLLDKEIYQSMIDAGAVPDFLPQEHADVKRVFTYAAKNPAKSGDLSYKSAQRLVQDADSGVGGALILLRMYEKRLLSTDEMTSYRELGLKSILVPDQIATLNALEQKSGIRFKVALEESLNDFLLGVGASMAKGLALKAADSQSPPPPVFRPPAENQNLLGSASARPDELLPTFRV